MFVSLRGLTAALLAISALSMGAARDAAAVPVPPEPAPPSADVVPDGLAAEIIWDPSVDNLFDWLYAHSGVPTACATGRSPFPAKVAGQACEVVYEKKRDRDLDVLAFFGGSRGGSSRELGGDGPGSGFPDDPSRPTPVPLPGGLVLLASGIGALAAWRRWR